MRFNLINLFFKKNESRIEIGGKFLKNFEKNLQNLKNFKSNCIGTALYLTGEISEDIFLDDGDYEHILERMIELDFPLVGCVVGWRDTQNKDFYHMGVVTNLNPFLIINRRGMNGKIEKEHFKTVDKDYSIYVKKRNVKYFVPKTLELQIYEEFFSE